MCQENENLVRKILKEDGKREEGKGKSVYFIQTFEHSNIQTFLTSYDATNR